MSVRHVTPAAWYLIAISFALTHINIYLPNLSGHEVVVGLKVIEEGVHVLQRMIRVPRHRVVGRGAYLDG